MLKAAALLFGVSMVLGDDHINYNDIDSRFLVTTFNGNNFAISVDTCNPTTLLGSPYQKATCIDESNVILTFHQDNQCTGAATGNFTFDSSCQTGDGTYCDFNCDDASVDAYAAIRFGLSCDTEQYVTMNAALSVCTLTDETSINIYCEHNWAEMQYYDATGLTAAECTEDTLDYIVNATEECGFIVKTGGFNIFGLISDCTVDDGGSSSDSGAMELVATMSFAMASIFVGLNL